MRSTDPDDYADNASYVRAVHDRGLAFDLATVNRRRMLVLFGGGLFALAGCASGTDEPAGTTASPTATTSATATPTGTATADTATLDVDEVPDETAGPYPAD
jgi:hypothetical protein